MLFERYVVCINELLILDSHNRVAEAAIWGTHITGVRCHAQGYGRFETNQRPYPGHRCSGELRRLAAEYGLIFSPSFIRLSFLECFGPIFPLHHFISHLSCNSELRYLTRLTRQITARL